MRWAISNPALIAPYAEDFVKLLKSKNNRLVWGGMIALGVVAQQKADVVLAHLDEISRAMKQGSVITVDNAVQTLARAASAGDKYRKVMFPILIDHLKTCRPKDVPQHAEKSLPAVTAANRKEFVAALSTRMDDLVLLRIGPGEKGHQAGRGHLSSHRPRAGGNAIARGTQ